jgi:inorganic pyrophosphatase
MSSEPFWQKLDSLVASSEIAIDRPRGTAHPRYPEFIYPLDYGYLKETSSGDRGGIDLWRGSLPGQQVTGVVVTIDLHKHDSEIKILLDCTREEMVMIAETHNQGEQAGMSMERNI